jgi:hypothetical protein
LSFGLPNGNILLASSSLSEQSAPVASDQLLNTVGARPSLDQLEMQIKALHQQAISTQHGIQQLAEQDAGSGLKGLLSDDPWMMGAEGLVLALGAVLLGALLGRLTRRRRVVSTLAPAQSGFADSQVYLGYAEQIPMPPVCDTRRDLPADAIANHAAAPLPLVFNQIDFEPSVSFLELESVFGLFLDDAHPPVVVNGFDYEAAANEVVRVRKSLAQKRDARARQRAYEVSVHSSLPHMNRSSSAPPEAVRDPIAHAVMHGDERGEPSGGLDLRLDLPAALPLELHSAESEIPVAEEPLMAQDSHLTLVPFNTPIEPEAQTDATVQLALALEFEMVGLLDGAREIAREVLESGDDALRLKVEALMARLDCAGDSVAPQRSGGRRAAS